jgi:type IV secretion system protein TrbL
MRFLSVLLGLALAALAGPALAAEPTADYDFMNLIVENYRNASNIVINNIQAPLIRLLFMLFALEIGVWLILHLINKHDPGPILMGLFKRVMIWGLFAWVITGGYSMFADIVLGFAGLSGAAATGLVSETSSMNNAGGIMYNGMSLAARIWEAGGDVLGMNPKTWIPGGFILGMGVGTALLMAIVAILYALAWVEFYIITILTVVLFAFSMFAPFREMAKTAIQGALAAGLKLFLMGVMIGLGWSVVDTALKDVVDNISDDSTRGLLEAVLYVLIVIIFYVALVFQVPRLVQSAITGSVSMSLGSVMAATGTMLATGGLGAAMASKTMGKVGGMAEAGKVGFSAAREGGASGAMAAFSGLKAATVDTAAAGFRAPGGPGSGVASEFRQSGGHMAAEAIRERTGYGQNATGAGAGSGAESVSAGSEPNANPGGETTSAAGAAGSQGESATPSASNVFKDAMKAATTGNPAAAMSAAKGAAGLAAGAAAAAGSALNSLRGDAGSAVVPPASAPTESSATPNSAGSGSADPTATSSDPASSPQGEAQGEAPRQSQETTGDAGVDASRTSGSTKADAANPSGLPESTVANPASSPQGEAQGEAKKQPQQDDRTRTLAERMGEMAKGSSDAESAGASVGGVQIGRMADDD